MNPAVNSVANIRQLITNTIVSVDDCLSRSLSISQPASSQQLVMIWRLRWMCKEPGGLLLHLQFLKVMVVSWATHCSLDALSTSMCIFWLRPI